MVPFGAEICRNLDEALSRVARDQGARRLRLFLPYGDQYEALSRPAHRRHAHFRHAGLGQVSEIFEGNPPYQPRGCIAQAWGTAEVLRALVEDGYGITSAMCRAVAAVQ